ncbi:unnamed protein product, partial [Scytosiphon promiscuus]
SPAPNTSTPAPAQAAATPDRSREPSAEGSEIPSSSPDSSTERVSPPATETPARASAPLSGQVDSGENLSGPSSAVVDSGENRSGPSSGQVDSRDNRTGPSTGPVDRSPTSNNRQCLFPGCKSLPEYGLPGAARAVYCLSHKKGVMVLVSRGASDLQSSSDIPTVASPVAASRMTISDTPNSQASSARAARSGNKKKARTL